MNPTPSSSRDLPTYVPVDETGRWLQTFLKPPTHPGDLGVFGDYRVLSVIGKGGMAVVLRGHDDGLQRDLAIKLMLPRAAEIEGSAERFLREARVAAKLEHPRVVPIYRVGTAEGTPFLVMPLLKGESLASLLRRRKKLPHDEAAPIVRETAEGLAFAHAQGLVHRDIKPDNIWLEDTPEGRHVRLLDFGLARGGTVEAVTRPGGMVGTPQYMAPEQAHGAEPDPRADLFSLGCVLYESLTGTRPFDGPTLPSIWNQLLSHHPPEPHSLDGLIPADLSTLVTRLLAKKPEERVQTAREVIDRLSPGGETPISRRETKTELPGLASGLPTPAVREPTTLPRSEGTPTPPMEPPKPPRTSRRIYYGSAAVALIVTVALVVFMSGGKSDLGSKAKRQDGPTAAAGGVPKVKSFRIRHVAKIGEGLGEDRGTKVIGEDRFGAKFGDQVEFEIDFDQPVYAYLIALRPDGVMELIHPNDEKGLPPKSDCIRYPTAEQAGKFRYGLSDGHGLWAFAVAASNRPLPPFADWATEKPEFWGKLVSGKEWTYCFDGGTVEILPASAKLRAKDEPELDASKPFERTMRGLKDQSGAEMVYGWAFVVE